jgi:hypothetical protein
MSASSKGINGTLQDHILTMRDSLDDPLHKKQQRAATSFAELCQQVGILDSTRKRKREEDAYQIHLKREIDRKKEAQAKQSDKQSSAAGGQVDGDKNQKRTTNDAVTDGTVKEGGENAAEKAEAPENQEEALMDTPYLLYYKQILETCKEEERRQTEFGNEMKSKIKGIQSLYLYGLTRVRALQDLREAPDAILPGNF